MEVNKTNIQELVKYINKYFKCVLDKIKSEHARCSHLPAYKPHRLAYNLEIVGNILERFDTKKIHFYAYEVASLIELDHLRAFSKKCKDSKEWLDILDNLKTKFSYEHTYLQLVAKEYLELFGYRVELIASPKKSGKSIPDLRTHIVNNSEQLVPVLIECYKPQNKIIDNKEKVVDYILKKSKRQLADLNTPSLFFLMCEKDNKPDEDFKMYISNELFNRKRINLLGIIILYLHPIIEIEISTYKTLKRKYTIDIIENPNYFGQAKLETNDDVNNTGLIQLKQINTPLPCSSKESMKYPSVQFSNGYSDVLFLGNGTINYLCFKCKKVLAKNIWNSSLNNINLHCPQCGNLSFIDDNSLPEGLNIKSTQLSYGSYKFTNVVKLRNGTQILGKKKNLGIIRNFFVMLVERSKKIIS